MVSVRGWWLAGVALVAATGCRQILGLDDPKHDAPPAAIDAHLTDGDQPTIDTPDGGAVCFGTGLERVCLAQAPTGVLTFTDATIDTNASCDAVLSTTFDACVRAGTTISIVGQVVVTGTRPLVLLSSGGISIGVAGAIKAQSVVDGAGCLSGTNPTGNSGGQGGSFGTTGGAGGNGSNGSSNGGSAGAAQLATTLRSGCRGANGAGIGAADYGVGGRGGGAVYLIATSNIVINGVINVSGAGGTGGVTNGDGGGGGGSGGMIGLDAPSVAVAVTGNVFANGGGGAEGAGTGSAGVAGGESSSPLIRAIGGGNANGNAGDGGDGGAGAQPSGGNGFNGSGSAGGGGGGGGEGVIKAYGTLSNAGKMSPAPT